MVIKKITKVTLCIIAIIAVFSLFMAWRIGYFVDIQESKPKTCEAINLSGSTEDIDIDYKNGIAYLSILDRQSLILGEDVRGTIGMINLRERPLKVENAIKDLVLENFRPHGISLLDDQLVVINHPKQRGIDLESVEIFSIEKNRTLIHQKSIASELFDSPNDLVLVEEDKFYVGNDKDLSLSSFEKIQEQMGRPYSSIAYYDGSDISIAIDNLSSVSGIDAVNNQYILASETNAKRLAILKRDTESGVLKKIKTFSLNGSPDNINAFGESILVAQIPSVFALIQHFIALQKGEYIPSPSKIERLTWLESSNDLEKETKLLFLSEGNDFSTASVGAVWEDTLLIGSITDKKVYICRLNEYEQE